MTSLPERPASRTSALIAHALRTALSLAFCLPQASCRGEPRERIAADATSTTAATPPSPTAPASAPIADAAASSAPASATRPGAFANTDPSDDRTVGPPDEIADCEARLASAGITFEAATLPVHRDHDSQLTCGAPQVVRYVRGPGRIAYVPTPLLTCGMALALASYERILQEEADRVFRSPLVRIEQMGTYNCRGIVRFKGVVSEHSYANAIDLTRFTFKNGKSASVLVDFDSGDAPPARAAGDFLRAVSQRAQDEDVFSNVLTPFWDAAHKSHFHLDLARYRVDGVRRASR